MVLYIFVIIGLPFETATCKYNQNDFTLERNLHDVKEICFV